MRQGANFQHPTSNVQSSLHDEVGGHSRFENSERQRSMRGAWPSLTHNYCETTKIAANQ